jgi:hypothetical protein
MIAEILRWVLVLLVLVLVGGGGYIVVTGRLPRPGSAWGANSRKGRPLTDIAALGWSYVAQGAGWAMWVVAMTALPRLDTPWIVLLFVGFAAGITASIVLSRRAYRQKTAE